MGAYLYMHDNECKTIMLVIRYFSRKYVEICLCSITSMICEYKLQRREKLKGIFTNIQKTVLDVKSIQLTVPDFPIIAF